MKRARRLVSEADELVEAARRASDLLSGTLRLSVIPTVSAYLLPSLAVPTEVRRSELRVRPLAAPVPKRTLALVWRKRSSLRAALKQVAVTSRAAYPKP